MRRHTLFMVLALGMLVVLPNADAQFVSPGWGYGISVGGGQGDNVAPEETWQPRFRFHIQNRMIAQLGVQVGVSYVELEAPDVYSTQTGMADVRVMYSPIHFMQAFPYFYAGFGVTKDWGGTVSTDYLPIVPMGIGIETSVSPSLNLQITGGYNLSLSDDLDGRVRTDEQENNLTNGKHDGFFDVMVGLVYTTSAKSLDADKDGLTNAEEEEYGTNPKKADTDGDGLSDWDEIKVHNTAPLNPDTDGDGLSDGDEVKIHKTNPLMADTDGDGLSDGEEVNIHKTNPLKDDTDGDGLRDGDEINIHRTDPFKKDSDGDGLSDGLEVNQHHTDPLVTDTDGDGLSDGDEVNKYKTDPTKADTDGDGLSDGDEVNKHKTDPLKVDSDDGGMIDGAEIKAGKNPLDPKDDLFDLSRGKKVILNGINFGTDKYSVLPESEWVLEKARASLVAHPDVTVVLSGHTDSVGDDDSNRTLSLKRAQSVKDWLVQKGIPANRIKVVGKGEAEPIASNDTDAGRAQNRRMEFLVE